MDQFEDKLRLAFVAVTEYYRENETKGAATPMPTDLIRREMRKLLKERDLEVNKAKTVEIELSDDKLKNVYGEDWLTYRDDRLKELESERTAICEAFPDPNGGNMDVQAESEGQVDTPSPDKDTDRRGESDSKTADRGTDSIVS